MVSVSLGTDVMIKPSVQCLFLSQLKGHFTQNTKILLCFGLFF